MANTHFSGPVISANGFTCGSSGTQLTQIIKGTVSINPASLANATDADTSVTITGVAAGDVVILQPPAAGLTAGLLITGVWVSAADTVKVRLYNGSGGTIDEAAGTWTYIWIKG